MAGDGSFLGTGWAFPPTFTANGGDVAMVTGVEDVHQGLQVLLATLPGERLMQTDFGCDLLSVMFEEVDQRLVNRLSSLISDAILFHETRVRLDNVDIQESEAEAGLLMISIDYTIKTTNSRFNMVYPFHLTETSNGFGQAGG
jgi:phage baseplate assembly protein W